MGVLLPRWPRRPVLFCVHMWAGLAAGLYVVIVCGTGAALVFRIDMQRASHPRLFTPGTGGPPADITDVMEAVRDAYPGHRLSGVDAPTTLRPTFLAYATRGDDFATILVDPVGGGVLGELPSEGVVPWLQNLHFNLLAGRIGRIVNGIGALLLLTLCGTGFVVWWPGVSHWRRGLSIDVSRPWRRIVRDAHGALGICTVVLIAMWATSGLYFAFPSQFRSVVHWISPIASAVEPSSTPPGSADGERPTWRSLIDAARRHVSGQHVARVVVPSSDTGAFLVMFSNRAPTPAAGASLTSVRLDQFTGQVLDEPPPERATAGTLLVAWMAPLHVGNFGGTRVRIVWGVIGLAPPLLAITGLLMWWTRMGRAYFTKAKGPRCLGVSEGEIDVTVQEQPPRIFPPGSGCSRHRRTRTTRPSPTPAGRA